jgi:hypothetical protein
LWCVTWGGWDGGGYQGIPGSLFHHVSSFFFLVSSRA